jgi:hypothetical protein
MAVYSQRCEGFTRRAISRLAVAPYFTAVPASHPETAVSLDYLSKDKGWRAGTLSTGTVPRVWRMGLGAFLLTAFISVHAQPMPLTQTGSSTSTNTSPASVSLQTTSNDASSPSDDAPGSNMYKNMSLQELMDLRFRSSPMTKFAVRAPPTFRKRCGWPTTSKWIKTMLTPGTLAREASTPT